MPSLFCIQGSHRGTHFDLEALVGEPPGAVTLGREKGNLIQLDDHEVSRRHAEIRREEDLYRLVDLSSSNGSFVNNRRVDQSTLTPGDHVQLGRTLFLFSGTAPANRQPQDVEIIAGDGREDGSRIISAIPDDAGELGGPPLPLDDTQNHWLARARSNLQVMYRTALAVSHTLEIDELLNRVLQLVFEWVEADRGCIMLIEPETGRLTTKARRDRDAGSHSSMAISRTILDYVLDRREGVLTSDAQEDDRFRSGQSVMRTGVHEAICVPMQGRYGQVGLLYVDTLTPLGEALAGSGQRFTDEHLKLMVAIGHQAALAIEDTTYYSAMVQAERLAAVGQTIATLSHHIKNILQGIRGGSYLVEMGLDNEDLGLTDKGWGIVRRNQNKISSLVMDMLSFSKDREPDPVPSDLPAIITDIVETVAQRAEEAEVTIGWQPPDGFPKLLFDPEAISRAVLNVVTNAIDAVEDRAGGRVEISAELDEEQKAVQIAVSDNGPGIPADALSDIFNLFVSTKGARGTGLGLTVSRKILREHGGDITVASSPRTGSRFTLRFPFDLGGKADAGSSGTVTDAKLPADFDASLTP